MCRRNDNTRLKSSLLKITFYSASDFLANLCGVNGPTSLYSHLCLRNCLLFPGIVYIFICPIVFVCAHIRYNFADKVTTDSREIGCRGVSHVAPLIDWCEFGYQAYCSATCFSGVSLSKVPYEFLFRNKPQKILASKKFN